MLCWPGPAPGMSGPSGAVDNTTSAIGPVAGVRYLCAGCGTTVMVFAVSCACLE